MRKKLLAMAVAGAVGSPAVVMAQSSTVQIFGTMYVEYSYVDQPTAAGTTTSRTGTDFLQTPGSQVGFKGEEKLGGGFSAWFQCVSTADPRGQSQEGWCARNSALGLKGGFGNVFIGNWDTPFKRALGPNNVGGNVTGVWGTSFLLTGQATTTTVGASRTTFQRRQRNSINYDSPNFGGFQVMAAFTASQPSTGTLSTATNNKPRVLSLGGQYSAGPLYVSAGYEQLRDHAGAGGPNNSNDNGWHVGASYTWGPVRVGGLYTRQEFETGLAGGAVKVSAYHIGVDWKIVGPHGLRAAYTEARDVRGPAAAGLLGPASGAGYRPVAGGNTGANLMQIRYVYTFSKRTELNVGYSRLDNDSAAAYRLGGLNAAVAGGSKEDAIAVALRHRF